MVELRKRKAPTEAAPPPIKKANSVKSNASAKKDDSTPTPKPASPTAGDLITLEGFGGEIETNDGEKTSLKKLVDGSKSGVVLFTYPRASTPGCTTQACLFRDEYTSLTATGFSIYGLSTDSPKSNTTFKTKQNLPYALLCDPKATLIAAIGMKKSPSGTTRGVFVVDKSGKVEAVGPGGPAATVDMVRSLIGGEKIASRDDVGKMAEGEPNKMEIDEAKPSAHGETESKPANGEETKADVAKADVAAEVADSAEKLDAPKPANGDKMEVDEDKASAQGEAASKPATSEEAKIDVAKANVAGEVADSAEKLDAGAVP